MDKPIKKITPHPQLENHFLIEFDDGTFNIAPKRTIDKLGLTALIQPTINKNQTDYNSFAGENPINQTGVRFQDELREDD